MISIESRIVVRVRCVFNSIQFSYVFNSARVIRHFHIKSNRAGSQLLASVKQVYLKVKILLICLNFFRVKISFIRVNIWEFVYLYIRRNV